MYTNVCTWLCDVVLCVVGFGVGLEACISTTVCVGGICFLMGGFLVCLGNRKFKRNCLLVPVLKTDMDLF